MKQPDSLAIQTFGLSRTFGDFVAVDRLDLSVGDGELFSVLGPNGAGKTTTIKMLCCLLRPTAGTARIMGHDILTDALAVKRAIAVSPQETAIAPHLNAWENLSLLAGLHGIDKQRGRQRSGELIEMFGLAERAKQQAGKYSGGMQRRLSIAMALISEPQVLFLDEPTIGLDPQARRDMWKHIAGLKGAITTVLTTHYLEEADALADRVAIVDAGTVVALDTPTELKRGISDRDVTIVQVDRVTDEALAALRTVYPTVQAVEGGFEIEADDVNVYAVGDCLRPLGIVLESSHRRQVTLDDVFLQLTGKQLRQ